MGPHFPRLNVRMSENQGTLRPSEGRGGVTVLGGELGRRPQARPTLSGRGAGSPCSALAGMWAKRWPRSCHTSFRAEGCSPWPASTRQGWNLAKPPPRPREFPLICLTKSFWNALPVGSQFAKETFVSIWLFCACVGGLFLKGTMVVLRPRPGGGQARDESCHEESLWRGTSGVSRPLLLPQSGLAAPF